MLHCDSKNQFYAKRDSDSLELLPFSDHQEWGEGVEAERRLECSDIPLQSTVEPSRQKTDACEAACHADVLTALLYRRCVPNTPISLTKLLSLGAALDIPIRSKGPRGKIHTVLSLRIRQRWRLFSSYRTSFSGTLLPRYRRTRPPPPPPTSLPPTSARATPPLTPGQG